MSATATLPTRRDLLESGVPRPHREYRLRHSPPRDLSGAELATAHRLGYLSTALFNAECFRRENAERVAGVLGR